MTPESVSPWRRLMGLCFLGVVVLLWTVSSFIVSSMFADDSFSKPYLITYINASLFAFNLLPFYIRHLFRTKPRLRSLVQHFRWQIKSLRGQAALDDDDDDEAHNRMLRSTDALLPRQQAHDDVELQHSLELPDRDGDDEEDEEQAKSLTVRETMHLAIKFGCFGFIANWLNAITFVYTTVASSTILTSTSSVFTLIVGAYAGVERFTVNKLIGVTASMVGIIIIALLDQNAEELDPNRGSFPWKSPAQVALGDAFALLSAIIYSVYATILAKTVGDESRVNMPLFFGFVGVAAFAFMWPGIIVLHLVGMEPFEMPSGKNLWGVIIVNGLISLIADMSWAYAVLMTSPLITAVGLSLTIPLSLVGQMLVNAQYSSAGYWFGAVIVVVAFVFINHESKVEEEPRSVQIQD